MTTPQARKVITFYSYKGGVGRTMTLANVAWRLANKSGFDVVVADWDLEAPGLHRFFGITEQQAAETNGVLDFLEEWQRAVDEKRDAGPDCTPWLLPVRPDLEPRSGSLRVLLAGKQTPDYAQRIASFDWRSFYTDRWGATGVETLRRQLTDAAQVVLVDSRTGVTDIGSVCTVQLPDGVVLTTTPTEQGIAGIERVARIIRQGDLDERHGRDRATVWVSIARLPWDAERDKTEKWLADHKEWWATGLRDGLWEATRHGEGLKTYTIAHSDAWTIGENLLTTGTAATAGADAEREQIARDFDRLADGLAAWLRGEESALASSPPAVPQTDPDAIERRLREARGRKDIPGQASALYELGVARRERGDRPGAVEAFLQAVTLERVIGDDSRLATAVNAYGLALGEQGRRSEALVTAQEAVALYRALAKANPQAFTPDLAAGLNNLANHQSEAGDRQAALDTAQEAVALRRSLAAANPQAFTADLAMSLNNLALRQSEAGDRPAALVTAQEAVSLYRALANANPQAFTPVLATSLDTLGVVLRAVGGREQEALAFFSEGLRLLAPFVVGFPQGFASMAHEIRANYLAACAAAGVEPDEALLRPIAEALATLPSDEA